MLVIRAGIHKMHVRIANRDGPDPTASSEADQGLHCLSRHFKQAPSVQNFRTSTVHLIKLQTSDIHYLN